MYNKRDIEQMEQIAYKRGVTDTIYNIIGVIAFIAFVYAFSLIVALI